MSLQRITQTLVRRLDGLSFSRPVTHVYNPLVYAAAPYGRYLRRFGGSPREVLLVGMNPGPWGMVQTGIPFGEVSVVRDWLKITRRIGKPCREHPKRPVLGLACPRREVSGQRLWGWAQAVYQTPSRFFERFFVVNYCPLCFLEAGGKNRTPDKLPVAERSALFEACDAAIRHTVELLSPRTVIGVGAFAESRLVQALDGWDGTIGRAPHPSPASPAANRGWAEAFTRSLRRLGINVPA